MKAINLIKFKDIIPFLKKLNLTKKKNIKATRVIFKMIEKSHKKQIKKKLRKLG